VNICTVNITVVQEMSLLSRYSYEVLYPRHEYNEFADGRMPDERPRTAAEKAFNGLFVKWAETVLTKSSRPSEGGLAEFSLPQKHVVEETPQAGRVYNALYNTTPVRAERFLEALETFYEKDKLNFADDFNWYLARYIHLSMEQYGIDKLCAHTFAKHAQRLRTDYPDLIAQGVVGALKFVDLIQNLEAYRVECDALEQKEREDFEALVRADMMSGGGARKRKLTKRKRSRTSMKGKRRSARRSHSKSKRRSSKGK